MTLPSTCHWPGHSRRNSFRAGAASRGIRINRGRKPDCGSRHGGRPPRDPWTPSLRAGLAAARGRRPSNIWQAVRRPQAAEPATLALAGLPRIGFAPGLSWRGAEVGPGTPRKRPPLRRSERDQQRPSHARWGGRSEFGGPLTGVCQSLGGSPGPLYLARSLADLGSTLRRRGHRVEARKPLREALEIAARCGAVPLDGTGTGGTAGGRCPSPARSSSRRRSSHPKRASSRSTRRRGPLQPRDRAGPVHQHQDGCDPPWQQLRQAWHRIARSSSPTRWVCLRPRRCGISTEVRLRSAGWYVGRAEPSSSSQ